MKVTVVATVDGEYDGEVEHVVVSQPVTEEKLKSAVADLWTTDAESIQVLLAFEGHIYPLVNLED